MSTTRMFGLFIVLGMVAVLAIPIALITANGVTGGKSALDPQERYPNAVSYDLNALKLYRASEWGLAAPEEAPASWHDLNALTLYRASEWGAQADTMTPDRLYRDLMRVK